MNKGFKIYLIIMLAVMVAFSAWSIYTAVNSARPFGHVNWQDATAVVDNTRASTHIRSAQVMAFVHFTTTAGDTIHSALSGSLGFYNGQQLPICYNPAQPEQITTPADAAGIRYTWLFGLLPLVAVAYVTYNFFHKKKTS